MSADELKPKNWFYRIGVRQFGPVDEPEMVLLFEKQTINAQTWTWQEGTEDWVQWGDTPLHHSLHPIGPPPFLIPPKFSKETEDPNDPIADFPGFERKMETLYFHFWLWTVIGLVLLVIVVGLIPLLVATVFELMILYYAWKSVPENKIGVPPILAVLLLLVPVLGAIWCFWAYYFFAKEMNNALTKRGSNHIIDEQWVLGFCVLYVITGILVSIPTIATFILGGIVGIPCSIIGIFVLKSIKEGLLEIYRADIRAGEKKVNHV